MAFRILLIRKPQQRKDNLNGIRNRFVHVAKLVRYLDSSKKNRWIVIRKEKKEGGRLPKQSAAFRTCGKVHYR